MIVKSVHEVSLEVASTIQPVLVEFVVRDLINAVTEGCCVLAVGISDGLIHVTLKF